MKVLIVDCFDSFTYNLVQQVGRLGATPVVMTCDASFREIAGSAFDRIILSPGPGKPEDSGLCLEVLHSMSRSVPTLGVCLGHQAICYTFGGEVVRAAHLVHGKVSTIVHDGQDLFSGVCNPFTATRYHSLIAERESLPSELEVCATSRDDGYVMGVRHRRFPIRGVQFHPESILTQEGDRILSNFLASTAVCA
ncbi:anthranilate synthase/aminodeoxychorismate synthase-like glutamine amidotransferase [Methanolinea mesophila]|uniref:anthranilate synthase component II n=1 Tax=Methanolinea mesophila TaxID=547055 RepID=UPI001AE1687D|nr:aminodeoxychorismate/anthranilate synthase component II [Methanolinea mesophila]MBP1929315.1 anthranilate synthase/aminodeoxychorismate synthase-like glutamine amidotransferase [Methanolinea mesophila]